MRRALVLMMAVGMSLAMLGVASASTPNNDSPANNKANCDAVNGVWERMGPANSQCTVGGSGEPTVSTVSASHPQQAWTVRISTSAPSTVYYKNKGFHSVTTTGSGAVTVLECRNHNGNLVGQDEEDYNKNCQPAS